MPSPNDFNMLRNEVEALEVRLEEKSREEEKWRLAYQTLATQGNSTEEVEGLKAKLGITAKR
jgi:hypothetical protein